MKKSLIIAAVASLFATHLFAAAYWVVMRDGTKYQSKAKPVVQGNRAMIQLVGGTTLVVDNNAIDYPKSEEVTRLGGGEVIGTQQTIPQPSGQSPQSTLGSQIHLRKLQTSKAPVAPPVATPQTTTPVAPVSGSGVNAEVIDKFTRAYENVGIFEHAITGTGPAALRADLTADSEDKVFNILSATAFLINHNAGIPGTDIGMVELFIKTTTGGAAGRFRMSRADAQALQAKDMSHDALADYFIRNVLY